MSDEVNAVVAGMQQAAANAAPVIAAALPEVAAIALAGDPKAQAVLIAGQKLIPAIAQLVAMEQDGLMPPSQVDANVASMKQVVSAARDEWVAAHATWLANLPTRPAA